MVFGRKTRTPKGAFSIGIIMLVFAVVFAVFTTCQIIKNDHRKGNCTEKTDAEIVDIVEKKESGRYGRIKYHPVVVYKVGMNKYEHTVEVGNKEPDDRKIGETMEILYDPDDPETACTETELSAGRRFSLMMLFYTAAALGIAIYYLHKSKKLKLAQTVQSGGYGPGLDEMN